MAKPKLIVALVCVLALVGTACSRKPPPEPRETFRNVGGGVDVPDDKKSADPSGSKTSGGQTGGGQTSGGQAGGGRYSPLPPPKGFTPDDPAKVQNVISDLGGGRHPCAGLLRPKPYTELVIEIDFMSGRQPSQAAISFLLGELRKAIPGKTIRAAGSNQLAGDNKTSYSSQDVLKIAASQERQNRSKVPTASIWVAYLDGNAAGDSPGPFGVLGYAIGGTTVIALFPDKFKQAGPEVSLVEKTVLLHEVGHILGLVHICEDHNHKTAEGEHEGSGQGAHHNASKDSVMYYAAEQTSEIASVLFGDPLTFDSRDLADLRAVSKGTMGGAP